MILGSHNVMPDLYLYISISIYLHIYIYVDIDIYTFITVITKLQVLLLTYLSMRVFAQTCHTRSVFLGGSGLGGSAWTLLGAGAGSGCGQSSWRLEAQIRTEAGGSGWSGFAPEAYLSPKVSSKFHLLSQISCLFFCRGTNRTCLLYNTPALSKIRGKLCPMGTATCCWTKWWR